MISHLKNTKVLFFLLLICPVLIHAQTGINTTAPHTNSALDVVSSTKGVLLPRLNDTQVGNLANIIGLPEGMLVYNTDENCLQIYTGTAFECLVIDSAADPTKDAWIDDPDNTQIKLGAKSNGNTRDSDTDIVVKDNGNVGIGLTNPAGTFDIKGKMYVNNRQTLYYAGALNTTYGGSLFIGDGGQNLSVDPAATDGTSGTSNIGVGALALKEVTSGYYNIAVGTYSQQENRTGKGNVSVGRSALSVNRTGGSNVAVGNSALTKNTSSGNTAIGDAALQSLTTGSYNTAVGWNVAQGLSTGSYNTIIGSRVTLQSSDYGMNNNIILADGLGNQRIRVIENGNTGIGTTTPTARLNIKPASANESGLRIEGLSDSKGRQIETIKYTAPNNPLSIDGAGHVFKKFNPVLQHQNATSFDGSYNITNSAQNIVSVNNGSIFRFQMYNADFELGSDGIGLNLYAEITYAYNSGFRVATYAYEVGGSGPGSTNPLMINGEGTQTLTFDFNSGGDLVLSATGTGETGSIRMNYSGTPDSSPVVMHIFQSFRSR